MAEAGNREKTLSDSDQRVQDSLVQIFPQLTVDVIQRAVLNPVNRDAVFDEASLLQTCIDDLLELRTFRNDSLSSASTGDSFFNESLNESKNSSCHVFNQDANKSQDSDIIHVSSYRKDPDCITVIDDSPAKSSYHSPAQKVILNQNFHNVDSTWKSYERLDYDELPPWHSQAKKVTPPPKSTPGNSTQSMLSASSHSPQALPGTMSTNNSSSGADFLARSNVGSSLSTNVSTQALNQIPSTDFATGSAAGQSLAAKELSSCPSLFGSSSFGAMDSRPRKRTAEQVFDDPPGSFPTKRPLLQSSAATVTQAGNMPQNLKTGTAIHAAATVTATSVPETPPGAHGFMDYSRLPKTVTAAIKTNTMDIVQPQVPCSNSQLQATPVADMGTAQPATLPEGQMNPVNTTSIPVQPTAKHNNAGPPVHPTLAGVGWADGWAGGRGTGQQPAQPPPVTHAQPPAQPTVATLAWPPAQPTPATLAQLPAQPTPAKLAQPRVLPNPAMYAQPPAQPIPAVRAEPPVQPTPAAHAQPAAQVTPATQAQPPAHPTAATPAQPSAQPTRALAEPPTQATPDVPAQQPAEMTPPKPATKEEQIEEMLHEVVALVTDVELSYARDMLRRFYGGMYVVNDVCNALMEEGSYPRQAKPSPSTVAEKEVKTDIDFYKELSHPISSDYVFQCKMLLQNDFKKISVKDLRIINNWFNGHYAPTRKCILDSLNAAGVDIKNWGTKLPTISSPNPTPTPTASTSAETKTIASTSISGAADPASVKISANVGGNPEATRVINIKFLKCGRLRNVPLGSAWDPLLKQEVDFVIKHSKLEKEEQDHAMALSLNENEYKDAGQLIECGCCYVEVSFESMVQCYEGHLFCQDCLRSYAKEAVFGQGKAKMQCMGDGCEAIFPKSQMMKALPSNVLDKYDERLQEESLNLADMENLVRCPHCEYAALMDNPNDKVFKCQNPSCLKETCRFCKEDWTEHFGIPCSELEKKDETKLRLKFEEKMTMAKIRVCSKCKQSFTKLDGCNKITCRCGAKMCYICRKPNIDYNHFCNHPRDPGKGCTKCTNCSLWTNPDEDDDRAVKEIQDEANNERKAQGFEDDRLIGAPEEKKKPEEKKQQTAHAHAQGHGHAHAHAQRHGHAHAQGHAHAHRHAHHAHAYGHAHARYHR